MKIFDIFYDVWYILLEIKLGVVRWWHIRDMLHAGRRAKKPAYIQYSGKYK